MYQMVSEMQPCLIKHRMDDLTVYATKMAKLLTDAGLNPYTTYDYDWCIKRNDCIDTLLFF